jgi:AcrR family transcriptional regulator
MPRPSRNLDRALLAAGRVLIEKSGASGLTIRQVAEAADVNIGMFHYHFKTREAFVRAVLQETYDEMFLRLSTEVARPADATPVEHLRAAIRVIARFLRDNRVFIARVLADALGGDDIARDFLAHNMPRHFTLLAALIAEGQRTGALKTLPPAQLLGFCAGAVGMPILGAGMAVESGRLPRPVLRMLADTLLTDAAIDQRIDLALAAIAAESPARAKTPRKRKTS